MGTRLRANGGITLLAWTLMLFTSYLPDAAAYELTGQVPGWVLWAKVSLLAAFLALCLFRKEIQPLWPLALIIGAFYVADFIKSAAWNAAWFQRLWGERLKTFATGQPLWEVFELAAALMVLGVAWAIRHRPVELFLSRGDIHSKVTPVRWLGIGADTSVRAFGLVFLLIVCISLLLILVPGARLSEGTLARVLLLLPIVLCVAALNALGEEIGFRVPLISSTCGALGTHQAVWLAAVFFGLAHYIGGQPSGIPGVLITTFLGWGFGKVMTESRGILFPWFLHFVMNSIIFFSNAAGNAL